MVLVHLTITERRRCAGDAPVAVAPWLRARARRTEGVGDVAFLPEDSEELGKVDDVIGEEGDAPVRRQSLPGVAVAAVASVEDAALALVHGNGL